MNYIVILCLISLATFASAKPSCPGCGTEVKGDELKVAEERLENSLSKLAALGGPFYKIDKVNSATTQVVSGTLDIINADLQEKDGKIKTCDVKIWSQPWLKEDAVQVTFDCPGEEKVTKKHNA